MLVEGAGLVAKRIELIPKDMTQKGRDGLSGWIRTTWLPFLERIPDEMQSAFAEELVGRYSAEHHEDAQGSLHVTMMRLEVEAVNEEGVSHARGQ